MVTVYSRHGCHLCEIAVNTLEVLQKDVDFEFEVIYIDGNPELEELYGELVPVTHIDGKHHDYWRVDPDRFKSSLEKRRLNQ